MRRTGRFSGIVARTDDGRFECGKVELTPDDLPTDGTLIEVKYSTVNYKDALAARVDGRVARISPLVLGIDLAGTVLDSDVPGLSPGDRVLAHGYDLGVGRHGGLAEIARVPSDWIVPLPDGLTLETAMAVGTAGYTAALSVVALEEEGVHPGDGPVLVTGATGGVGSMAVGMLAGLGYEVVASTGKANGTRFLKDLGAAATIDRTDHSETTKPLMPAAWRAAVDCVGGATLAGVLARVAPGGTVAASGNVGGAELVTTVLPFILRGVTLRGIDSVQTPITSRRDIWRRIGMDLRPKHLDRMYETIGLDEVPEALERVFRGDALGRTVVQIAV
jgi:putative YhdH/YhfP family quinone oxidoreductase